jgi:3-isopropylmalate dehydrogenase
MIQGGMGVAAGGNVNPDKGGVSMFEPMGGSAPKYTGQNVINPIAAINAGTLLLENIGEIKAAKDVDNAVIKALESGKIKSMSAGKMGLSTTQVGDLIANLV